MISFLHSPGKIPRETVIKIIVIGLVIIVAGVLFGNGERGYPVIQTSGSAMAPMALGVPGFSGKTTIARDDYAYGDAGGVAYNSAEMAYEENMRPYPDPIPPPYDGNAGSPDFPTERKVIRNGSLSLVVNDVGKAVSDIAGIAERLGGWIDNQNIYEYRAGEKQGNLSLRIPGEKFMEAMTLIKTLGVRVENENINSSDVSAQVVDLEANLANYKAEEAQYQEIMKRSGKISEVLDVARALSQVRGNIERTQGQLNHLSRQVAMSVISVNLTPVANAKEVTDEWRPILVIKESLKNLAQNLTDLADGIIMFVIQVLPVLALKLGVLILVIWAILKGGRRFFVNASRNTLLPSTPLPPTKR